MSYVTTANVADNFNKDLTEAGEALVTDLLADAEDGADKETSRGCA